MSANSGSRIDRRFADLARCGEKALITYTMAGDPNVDASVAVVLAMAAGGADVVELGLPFSDPVADGPVIQAAGNRALAAGMTGPERFFSLVRRVRAAGCQVPLVVMTYYNPVLQRGLDRFCAEAAAAGLDGIIVPDLPVEEADELGTACRSHGLDLVAMLAPTSTPGRVAAVARQASGFIYCVSITGVTGAREQISDRFRPVVAATRQLTRVPVAVGFGIARPEQIRQVTAVADGAVVGSALVQLCGQGWSAAELAVKVTAAVQELKAGTR